MQISMDLLNTTGKRIRALRNDYHLTQEELTRQLNKAGVDAGRSYISILENSSKVPSGEVIQALARVLKTTSDYLLLLTDDPFRPGEIDEEARQVSDQEWDLVTALRSLPDPDRLTLMEMTKELIGVARRQRQRTGRSMTDLAPALPASQVPPLPRSREELASYVLALPEELMEELRSAIESLRRK